MQKVRQSFSFSHTRHGLLLSGVNAPAWKRCGATRHFWPSNALPRKAAIRSGYPRHPGAPRHRNAGVNVSVWCR